MMPWMLCLLMCSTALTATMQESEAKSLVYYDVSLKPAKGGVLYLTYDDNMQFFYQGKNAYRSSCRISSNQSHKFCVLVDRGIIAKPDTGWYFDGFYDKSGKKTAVDAFHIEVIRITVDGRYYYDIVPSYDNPAYRNVTEKFFKQEIKDYVKFLYGTSRYKVMEKTIYYRLPKKSAAYDPRFVKMEPPSFPGQFTVSKDLHAADFYAAGKAGFTATYSSSSSKVVKVNKKTGLCHITGPGAATITIKVPASGKYCSVIYKVKVTVKPNPVSTLSASMQSDRKSVTVNWKGDNRNSGYEIQLSDTSTCKQIIAKKTISSGKTTKTKVTVAAAQSARCKYARIRPYKTAGGQKLYGAYLTVKIK